MSLIGKIQNTESIKFIIVGVSGVLVNYFILSISLYVFSLQREIAVALAIFVSMTTNYYFNRIWTFNSDKDDSTMVVFTVTSNYGCQDSDSMYLYIYESPLADFDILGLHLVLITQIELLIAGLITLVYLLSGFTPNPLAWPDRQSIFWVPTPSATPLHTSD